MIGQRGWYAFHKLIDEYEFETVLDVGAGDGTHARAFAEAGKQVTAVDIRERPADIPDDVAWLVTPWASLPAGGSYDVVWLCHALEHDPNPGIFLESCRNVLGKGGVLAVTVPPAKQQIVGGHLSIWLPGLLLYHLAMAGFDCSNARLIQRAYDISCIVPAAAAPLPELEYDTGDVTRLAKSGHLPKWFADGMDGEITDLNWGPITGGDHDTR